MKIPPIVFIIGGVLLAGFLLRQQAQAAIDAVSDVNEGTPFEGTGVVGTVGNITDAASGGALSTFGSFLGLQGSKLFNFFETGEFK